MPGIVDRVTQDAARGARAKDGGVGAAGACGSDSKKDSFEIFCGEGAPVPGEGSVAGETLDGCDGTRADDGDTRSAKQQAFNFCSSDAAGTDDDTFFAGEADQHREESVIATGGG